MKEPLQLRTFGDLPPLPEPSPRSHCRETPHLPPPVSSPHVQSKRPQRLPRSPQPRKDLGRNFGRRSRPTSPQPGRRAASSPPPPKMSPHAGDLSEQGAGGAAGAARGEGAGGRDRGKGHSLTLAVAAGSRRGVERGRRGGRHGAGARLGWAGLGPGAARTAPHGPSAPPPACEGSRGAGGTEGGDPAGRRCRAPATPAVTPPHPPRGCPAGGTAPPPPPQRPPAPGPLPARPPPAFPRRSARPQPPPCPRLPPSRAPARRERCLLRGRGLRAAPRLSPGGGMRGAAPSPLMRENAFIVAV